MSRSLKKGLYVDAKLQKKIEALSAEDRTIIKTWARESTISPEMVLADIGITTICLLPQIIRFAGLIILPLFK